ncbi:hypothetical protein [Deinococcus sp. Leaf326]|uniref:hypothetical protein n=1 Tax=Deinococcus sp. Leaf326 TaxID=1736338 RepID=UPI0006F26CB5|nr:hypothetical protein [Deinococcus sp. Leaf326]KQR33138.1 hypothetical protein ASF71_16745 [Deinococcus sp. Leaf326]
MSTSKSTKPQRRAPRLPSSDEAERLAHAQWVNPTEAGLRRTRRRLVRLMWYARAEQKSHLRAAYHRAYLWVCEMQAQHEWDIPAAIRETRQRNRKQPQAQYQREILQAHGAKTNPRRAQLRSEQQQRDLDRVRSNALAHALWAVHQGERDWTPLPVKDSDSTLAPGGEPTTGRPTGPSYLVVQVPPSAYGDPCRLELYRADYEALLAVWGYDRAARARRLRDKLRGSSAPDDLDALFDLACASAAHPNLALSWHGYVTSSRLGDVFAPHAASGGMQMASHRSGDLREALQEVYCQCRVVDTNLAL